MNYFTKNKNGKYDYYIDFKKSNINDNDFKINLVTYELLKDFKKN